MLFDKLRIIFVSKKKSMTPSELRENFTASGKGNRDFIKWAESTCGVRFYSSEITKHKTGKKISRWASGLYQIYFKLLNLT